MIYHPEWDASTAAMVTVCSPRRPAYLIAAAPLVGAAKKLDSNCPAAELRRSTTYVLPPVSMLATKRRALSWRVAYFLT